MFLDFEKVVFVGVKIEMFCIAAFWGTYYGNENLITKFAVNLWKFF